MSFLNDAFFFGQLLITNHSEPIFGQKDHDLRYIYKNEFIGTFSLISSTIRFYQKVDKMIIHYKLKIFINFDEYFLINKKY